MMKTQFQNIKYYLYYKLLIGILNPIIHLGLSILILIIARTLVWQSIVSCAEETVIYEMTLNRDGTGKNLKIRLVDYYKAVQQLEEYEKMNFDMMPLKPITGRNFDHKSISDNEIQFILPLIQKYYPPNFFDTPELREIPPDLNKYFTDYKTLLNSCQSNDEICQKSILYVKGVISEHVWAKTGPELKNPDAAINQFMVKFMKTVQFSDKIDYAVGVHFRTSMAVANGMMINNLNFENDLPRIMSAFYATLDNMIKSEGVIT